ncbi:MAG: DUF4105 domain-containing protein [Patescibacteria group bacterium]|nr:DUF4105 domain-containing protein [Patescibacteria group bacterium]
MSLRSDYRKNDVYIYPIKIDSFLLKKVFLNSLKKADYLSKKPEFYNTLTNNCITNILDNVNDISSKHII